MLEPNNSVTANQSSLECYTEFLDMDDDAWYGVRTVLQEEKLTVNYFNLADDHNSVFEPHSFKSLEELAAFRERFRPVSRQLQDHECRKVVRGTMVCASHSFDGFHKRFYDAEVDDVIYQKHSFANGEEECLCMFVVIWQRGPGTGYLANKKIESICLVQSRKQLDPKVARFLEIVKEKLKGNSHRPLSKRDVPSCGDGTHREKMPSLPTKPKSAFIPRYYQHAKCAQRSSVNIQPSEEVIGEYNESSRDDSDMGGVHKNESSRDESDMGGVHKHHVVLVDNLDKGLIPSTIVEFIQRHTSLSVQAYVFPSLSLETYTRGALVLSCEKDLEKLCKFLEGPNHIVMSWNGRPWVVTEKLSGHNTFTVPVKTLILNRKSLQHRSVRIRNGLKVAHSGSEEYRQGKRLLDLFMEFAEHQQRLHKRLAMLEKEISQPTPRV